MNRHLPIMNPQALCNALIRATIEGLFSIEGIFSNMGLERGDRPGSSLLFAVSASNEAACIFQNRVPGARPGGLPGRLTRKVFQSEQLAKSKVSLRVEHCSRFVSAKTSK